MYRNPANGSVKFVLAFCLSMVLRMLPFRPWNVEPILSVTMPFARAYGPVASFLFAFLSMALFDVIAGQVGMWTAVTSLTYGVVAIGAHYWSRMGWRRPILGYISYALVGTLFFDLVTMTSGPLFHGQPWGEALLGQVPFTLSHLLGNLALALTLTPLLDRYIVREPRLDVDALFASWDVKVEQ